MCETLVNRINYKKSFKYLETKNITNKQKIKGGMVIYLCLHFNKDIRGSIMSAAAAVPGQPQNQFDRPFCNSC